MLTATWPTNVASLMFLPQKVSAPAHSDFYLPSAAQYPRSAQIPCARSSRRLNFIGWRRIFLRVLSLEPAACHPSGAWNFQMATRFLEKSFHTCFNQYSCTFNDMGWACGAYVWGQGCIGSWWGNRREGDHWGDLGVDGWIILGCISRR